GARQGPEPGHGDRQSARHPVDRVPEKEGEGDQRRGRAAEEEGADRLPLRKRDQAHRQRGDHRGEPGGDDEEGEERPGDVAGARRGGGGGGGRGGAAPAVEAPARRAGRGGGAGDEARDDAAREAGAEVEGRGPRAEGERLPRPHGAGSRQRERHVDAADDDRG